MTTSAKHTQGPWYMDSIGLVRGDNGEIIADLRKSDNLIHDGSHIVRCVNSHDALVDALSGALLALEECANFTPTRTLPDSAAELVRAALAKAQA